MNRGTSRRPGTHNSHGKKPPRTVHIDVYCTGSDASSSSSSSSVQDSSSSSDFSADARNLRLEKCPSHSTNPTVYESFGMKLKHKRAVGDELPRKYLIDAPQRTPPPSNANVPSRSEWRDGW